MLDLVGAWDAQKDVKCVIWDLDNTLWHGTLAEGDDVQLKDGMRDVLATLDGRGILHSIASKNEAREALGKLRELNLDHYFLYPQISWNPKSQAVARIQEKLNVGMDTLLFVDDQPFEREEVASAHPSVRTHDAGGYFDLLEHPRLKPAVVSGDAGRRRLLYLANIKREHDEAEFRGTPEAFLATLDMVFRISPACDADLMRAEELTLRTNQLNSTGITYDIDDLRAFMRSESHDLLICELSDKYGSYGKIGLALVERGATHHHIRLLLMSCRIVSRGVGSVLLTYLMSQARAAGKPLRADFRRTERNRQMLVTYQFANFREIDRHADGRVLFENDLSKIQRYPDYVELIVD